MPASAGLHLTALVGDHEAVDIPAAVRSASAAGVLVRSVAPFYADTPVRSGIMLGYGAIPTDRIAAGLGHLEAALAGAPGNPVTRRGGGTRESIL